MKLLFLSILLCALSVRGVLLDEFPICDAAAQTRADKIIKTCYSCFADRTPWLLSRSVRPQNNCPAECCFKAYESAAIPKQFHVVFCHNGCCSRMVVTYKSIADKTWNFKHLTYVWNDSEFASKGADDVCSATTGNNRSCLPSLACAFLPRNENECAGRDTMNVNKPGKWSDKLPCPPPPPAAKPAAPAALEPVAAPAPVQAAPAAPKPVIAPAAVTTPSPPQKPVNVGDGTPAKPVTTPAAPPVPVSAPVAPANKPAAPAAPAGKPTVETPSGDKPDAGGDTPPRKPVSAGDNVPQSNPANGDGDKKEPAETEGDKPENGGSEENGGSKPTEEGGIEGVGSDSTGGTAKNSTKRDCFPSHARVYVQGGEGGVRIRMDELKVGDKVLVSTTEKLYSTVHTFTHSDRDVSSEFIRLHFDDNTLEVSSGHYVYVERRGLIAARSIKVGDVMSSQLVRKVDKTRATGLFNPHTLKGDIVVDGILASCYTEAVEVPEAHALLAPLRLLSFLGIFVPSVV